MESDRSAGAVHTAAASWAIYIAIGIAVPRHHLYDIDRLINHTVVYGLLTAGGVAVYVAVVKPAEWLLQEGSGWGAAWWRPRSSRSGSRRPGTACGAGSTGGCTANGTTPPRSWPGSVSACGTLLVARPTGMSPPGLQAVCEALRLPSAGLRVAGVEVASYGRSGTASEPIPLEHEGQQVGVVLVGLGAGERWR